MLIIKTKLSEIKIKVLKIINKNILESLIEGNNEDLCEKFMIKVDIRMNITVKSCPHPKIQIPLSIK